MGKPPAQVYESTYSVGRVIDTRLRQCIPAIAVVGEKVARPERFELPTNWFEASYSIQLSYGRAKAKKWWAQKDLNLRPIDYESTALTS
jgi:hypothetical protein